MKSKGKCNSKCKRKKIQDKMNLSLLVMKDEEVRLLKRQNDSSNKKKMMKMSEVKVNQVQKLKCLRLEVKRKKQLQA